MRRLAVERGVRKAVAVLQNGCELVFRPEWILNEVAACSVEHGGADLRAVRILARAH